MRSFAFQLGVMAVTLLHSTGFAQSLEPEPRVVEVGGEVDVRAWDAGAAPLTAVEIGLRGLEEGGQARGEVLVRATTDPAGVAHFRVDLPAGRYRFESTVGGVEVQAPFRVVAAAPRMWWAGLGILAVLIAGWAVRSGRGARSEPTGSGAAAR